MSYFNEIKWAKNQWQEQKLYTLKQINERFMWCLNILHLNARLHTNTHILSLHLSLCCANFVLNPWSFFRKLIIIQKFNGKKLLIRCSKMRRIWFFLLNNWRKFNVFFKNLQMNIINFTLSSFQLFEKI